jgi:hypothetical protein
MAYGLRIINDSSDLLVDSEFVNPTFIQKMEFNTTATYSAASDGRKHPGFIRRDYATGYVAKGAGVYIVLWALPNSIVTGEPLKEVWYQFTTSEATNNLSFNCSVYANSQGTPITYLLPTAYVFTVDAAGVNLMSSTGPALRMYNSSNVKTFDSNFLQLVPTYVSNNYSIPQGEEYTPLYMELTMVNPILLLPKTALMFAGDTGFGGSSYKVFDVVYRRRGQYLDTRMMSTSYYEEPDQAIGSPLITFPAGTFDNLTVIAANGDFYQASGAGTQPGSNPTYTLNSNYSSVNEGTIITITLTTTLITNGTSVPYTVTGIDAADIVGGSLTGNFVVQNNTASVQYTIKNDTTTEGTETFLLTLNGISSSTSVTILDTSLTPAITYSWATSPLTVDEGQTQSLQFNYTNAPANTLINFYFQTPLSGISASNDGVLNTTTFTTAASVSSGSVSVSYSVTADNTTEVTEYFRLHAQINGTTSYYSSDIAINDTSLTPSYGISAVNPPWNESTTQSTTVTLTNVNGYTYYPVSNNAAVTCQTTSFTVNSNNFTTTLYWNVGAVTADTTVTLELRRSRSNGVVDATTTVVVKDILPYGTAIGTAFCVANGTAPYTLRQVRADGAGGTYNDDTNNSITCGYVTPAYVLSANPTSSSEGNNFTITLTTNQSGSFPYTVTGISSADLEGADTTLTGSLSNNGTRTFSVKADASTEGTEVFSIKLNNNLSNTLTVSISDTSKAPTSISRTGSTSGTTGIAFSSSFTVAVNGTASTATWSQTGTIPTGLSLTQSGLSNGYYSTYTLSGTPTASGTFNFTINATTATGETATANYSVVIGLPAATYSWGGVDNVDENSATNTMSFNFTNAVNAAVTFALLAPTGTYRSGVSDITLSTTSGTANGTSSISVNYSAAADQATEGYEYFRIRATVGGVNYDTPDIVISDTSLWPANGTLLSASCLNNGVAPYTYRQVYADGSGGTYNVDTNNSATCGYTAPSVPQWRNSEVNTNWTVPTGTTSIFLAMIGGGAGGRALTSGGGGGAGGIYYSTNYPVTPGQTLSFTIGAGGTSNTAGGATTMSIGGTVQVSAAGGSIGAFNGGAAGANQLYGVTYSGGGGGSTNGGGGGGSMGGGYTGGGGEGGDGGFGIEFTLDGVQYTVAGGGGGAGTFGGIGGITETGFGCGAGNGASAGGSTIAAGSSATKTGSGGGGGRNNGSGGAGFKGRVWWYG